VPYFCEKVETQAMLHSTSPPSSLRSVTSRNKGFHQAANLSLFVEPGMMRLESTGGNNNGNKPHFTVLT
jgi:hypothetical protein